MQLRSALMPPKLDEKQVAYLTQLAACIDGARPGKWEELLEEFNRIAGTTFDFREFQGIYEAEEHDDWVRRVLTRPLVKAVPDVTREELVEIARRAMCFEPDFPNEAYMLIFDANVPLPNASNLIFCPPDYNAQTNTWDGGRPIWEYDPTPAQVVEWALNPKVRLA